MDVEWGWCPVCHSLLEEVDVPGAQTGPMAHQSCPSCGYARLVSKTPQEPWRK